MKQRAMAASAALLLLAAGILSCSGGSGTSPAPQLNCFTDPVFPLPANFSATGYWNNNLDLQNAFQTFDSVVLARHYCTNGMTEGRSFGDSPVYSSLALSSEAASSAGGSSGTSSSSSFQAFSSAAPGTLPAEFDAREYCYLNSDLAAYFGVSDCAGLNDAQRAQFADHYVNNGAAEGRWWNVLVQCSQRALAEVSLPCSSDSIAALRRCTAAECQSQLSACMADVPALAAANLPCDFGTLQYLRACQAAGNTLCRGMESREADYVAASWFIDGKENGWAYSNVPADFSGSGYCDLNSSIKAIYGPTCDQQTVAWHYSLFGRSQGLQYKTVEIVDPYADYAPITTEPAFKIIGYIQNGTSGGWNAPYHKMATHLVIFGPEIASNGDIVWKGTSKDDLKYWAYQGSKTDTRIMVAFGGNNKSANFNAIANAGAAQTNFLNQLAELKDYWVWGVDIDREDVWPYGAGLDQLVPAIYNKIHPLGMKVTVATGSTNNGFSSWSYADWVNVMCYDFNGNSSSCPGACMNTYSGHKSQAAIGVPFYTGGDGSAYASNHTNDLVSLSGMATATNSIKNGGYSGIMIWDLSQDKTDANNSLLYKIAATAGYNP